VQGNLMYWADFGTGVIRRSTLDGANTQDLVTGLAGPVGIALDISGGRIYWCEANAHAIRRADLDGTSPVTVLSGLLRPQYLTLDPRNNRIYWTELGGNGHGRIRKANLDGANPLTLLGDQPGDSVSYPSGIAMLASGVSTGIVAAAVPAAFSLEQNYPNPFNPATMIRFALPREAHVLLSVYDLLGRNVATLVNETKAAGVHEVRFDASRLASGAYVYRLEVRDPSPGPGQSSPAGRGQSPVQTKTLMVVR
jgi:hypothetical protein